MTERKPGRPTELPRHNRAQLRVTVTQEQLKALDAHAEARGYRDRAEAVRSWLDGLDGPDRTRTFSVRTDWGETFSFTLSERGEVNVSEGLESPKGAVVPPDPVSALRQIVIAQGLEWHAPDLRWISHSETDCEQAISRTVDGAELLEIIKSATQ